MKNLSVMIKPASSLCNMRCKYCFYADISSIREQPSYGVMTSETRKKVLSNIFSQLASGDSITFAFQGGEPTMAGIIFWWAFPWTARRIFMTETGRTLMGTEPLPTFWISKRRWTASMCPTIS